MRRDDGIGPRVMGRVRTLIGEIGCIRARRSLLTSDRRQGGRGKDPFGRGGSREPGGPRRPGGPRERGLLSALSLSEDAPRDPAEGAGRLIEWIEGGTDPHRLDTVLGDRSRVVLLDAVQLGTPPGTVHHWHLACSRRSRLSQISHYNGRSSVGLKHLPLWLEDELPPRGTDLIGVEPYDISEGEDLSRPIQSRLPAICSQVAAVMIRILEEEGW